VGDTALLFGQFAFSEYEFHQRLYLAGPKLRFGPVFIHALLGTPTPTTGFAAALGGGADLKLAPHFALRVSLEDVVTRIYVTNNKPRAGAGFVYSFGRMRETPPSPSTRISPTSMPIPMLGIIAVAARNESGAEIVQVLSSTVAPLRVGDVINSVDDKPVHSATELAAQLSNRTAGTKVRLGYMVRGYWQSEITLVLQPSQPR
jgi:PDZ domain